jgi:hypothetical protein
MWSAIADEKRLSGQDCRATLPRCTRLVPESMNSRTRSTSSCKRKVRARSSLSHTVCVFGRRNVWLAHSLIRFVVAEGIPSV